MRIRLHNSMGKMEEELNSCCLFDEKIFVRVYSGLVYLNYRIADYNFFLAFYSETNVFVECYGFGKNEKHPNPYWWKDPKWKWKEMR